MSPFTLLGWLLVIVVLTMCVAYFRPRRKPKITGASLTVEQASVMSFEQIRKREIGKHPALAAPYGKRTVPPTRKPTVAITPRQMESVNIKRKLRGYPPLNRAGVKNAISSAWDTPRREPQTTNDWLLYLILWETFSDDHKSHTCSGTGGFIIDPNLPYNGHGGEFAGAGASGSWTDAPIDVQSAAEGIAVGASQSYIDQHLDADPKYSPGDTVSGYASGGIVAGPGDDSPILSQGAVIADTPVSASAQSDTSSSSNSDTGSSGGGDSGGGGGGGGD